jgi:arylsulfatase A-like enzyme
VHGARFACILLASLLLVACGGGESERPRRVVVILLDALHAAHLSSHGGPSGLTPNLDRLARRGMRFERAFSNATWTLPSTASLMTGQLPRTHGVVTTRQQLEGRAVTAAELFRAEGWRTASFVQMVYASDSFGLDQGFEDFHYYGPRGGDRAASMPEHALAWLDRHGDERAFLYLHFRRPHSVYNPPPGLLARLDPGSPLSDGSADERLMRADTLGEAELTPEERARARLLYRANLAAIDLRLRELIDRCLSDPETLVVLLSDHGEALGQHGMYGHGLRLWAEVIDIPMVFAGPGVTRGVDAGPACTVDVLPTLLELADLSVPVGVELDGVSLAPRLRGEETAPRTEPIPLAAGFEGAVMRESGVVVGDLKVVVDDSGAVRVHDRTADPRELGGPDALAPDRVAELEALAHEHRDDLRGLQHGRRAEPDLDAERRADLAELGYGGDDGSD